MNEVNFSARISEARAHKAKVYLARKDKTNKQLIEHVIDNIEHIKPALDATCSTHHGRTKK